MDGDEHAADVACTLDRMPSSVDHDVICWCGREVLPNEDHGMCWPGM